MRRGVSTVELRSIETVLKMGGGYVLDFSDRTFTMFFEEFGVDIDDSRYCEHGGSKAKRLRAFLRASPPQLTARVLQGLLDHRLQSSPDDLPEDELKRYKTTIDRLARESSTVNTVSEVTRRAIFDEWRKPGRYWAGRLSETEFLTRFCKPDVNRHFDALISSVWQHRVANADWDDDWVFDDRDLNLLTTNDELFLSFLCLAVHPVVRPDETEAKTLVALLNTHLAADRWQIVGASTMSGKTVYAARRRAAAHVEFSAGSTQADVLTSEYVHELAVKTESRLQTEDFEGAITTARTMLEAVLVELELRISGKRGDYKGDLPRQFKQVSKCLRMDDERPDLDDRFKDVIRGLVMVANGLAPLRNKMSDGHARERKPAPHHARVVVNAAKTVAAFLVESYLFQRDRRLLHPPSKDREG